MIKLDLRHPRKKEMGHLYLPPKKERKNATIQLGVNHWHPIWSNPPPGGVSVLGGSQMKSPEKEEEEVDYIY